MEIRLARPADWPVIRRLHAEQNAAQGTDTALPVLFGADGEFARNIAMAFLVERDGVPVQAFWFICVPEVCFAGMDREATSLAQSNIAMIAYMLRSLGFSGLNCVVPQAMGEAIRPFLEGAGFGETTADFRHFFRDLRLPQRAEEE